jgi:hypothetical protein
MAKPIQTARDHRAALKEIEQLMGAKGGSPEGERLGALVTLVEAYERKRFPVDLPHAGRRRLVAEILADQRPPTEPSVDEVIEELRSR